MKKKIISLGMLVGAVALSSCIKEQGDKYKYLSTAPVSYSVPSGTVGASSSASLNEATFTWDASARTMTIQCASGYGYVKSSWQAAVASLDTNVISINSEGGTYTSTFWTLTGPGNTLRLASSGSNNYRQPSSTQIIDSFTCVPLNTDNQWAGN